MKLPYTSLVQTLSKYGVTITGNPVLDIIDHPEKTEKLTKILDKLPNDVRDAVKELIEIAEKIKKHEYQPLFNSTLSFLIMSIEDEQDETVIKFIAENTPGVYTINGQKYLVLPKEDLGDVKLDSNEVLYNLKQILRHPKLKLLEITLEASDKTESVLVILKLMGVRLFFSTTEPLKPYTEVITEKKAEMKKKIVELLRTILNKGEVEGDRLVIKEDRGNGITIKTIFELNNLSKVKPEVVVETPYAVFTKELSERIISHYYVLRDMMNSVDKEIDNILGHVKVIEEVRGMLEKEKFTLSYPKPVEGEIRILAKKAVKNYTAVIDLVKNKERYRVKAEIRAPYIQRIIDMINVNLASYEDAYTKVKLATTGTGINIQVTGEEYGHGVTDTVRNIIQLFNDVVVVGEARVVETLTHEKIIASYLVAVLGLKKNPEVMMPKILGHPLPEIKKKLDEIILGWLGRYTSVSADNLLSLPERYIEELVPRIVNINEKGDIEILGTPLHVVLSSMKSLVFYDTDVLAKQITKGVYKIYWKKEKKTPAYTAYENGKLSLDIILKQIDAGLPLEYSLLKKLLGDKTVWESLPQEYRVKLLKLYPKEIVLAIEKDPDIPKTYSDYQTIADVMCSDAEACTEYMMKHPELLGIPPTAKMERESIVVGAYRIKVMGYKDGEATLKIQDISTGAESVVKATTLAEAVFKFEQRDEEYEQEYI